MKCRRMVTDSKGIDHVVWFGSYGINPDGTAKKVSETQSQVDSNFVDDLSAIAQTLSQKLRVIRTELWHNMSFGLPLLEKKKSKAMLDTSVANIVLNEKNVISIQNFSSKLIKDVYYCDLLINTNFGQVEISI